MPRYSRSKVRKNPLSEEDLRELRKREWREGSERARREHELEQREAETKRAFVLADKEKTAQRAENLRWVWSVLRPVGILGAGIGSVLLNTYLLSKADVSGGVRTASLVVQGGVFGGFALLAKQDALAVSMMTAPWTWAAFRVSMGVSEMPAPAALPPGPPAGLPLEANAYLGHGANPGFA